MFGLFDKRKKELQRLGDSEAVQYLEDYLVWLSGSGLKDNWESFRLCFATTFQPDNWGDVAEDYDEFIRERFGLGTSGRANIMWIDGVCETYDSGPKDTESAIFFSYVGRVIRNAE